MQFDIEFRLFNQKKNKIADLFILTTDITRNY